MAYLRIDTMGSTQVNRSRYSRSEPPPTASPWREAPTDHRPPCPSRATVRPCSRSEHPSPPIRIVFVVRKLIGIEKPKRQLPTSKSPLAHFNHIERESPQSSRTDLFSAFSFQPSAFSRSTVPPGSQSEQPSTVHRVRVANHRLSVSGLRPQVSGFRLRSLNPEPEPSAWGTND